MSRKYNGTKKEMKKSLFILVLLFVPIICSAQIKIEKNNQGEYRQQTKISEWESANITADPRAVEYVDLFDEAISNPNTFILIERSEKMLKTTVGFTTLKEVKSIGISYDSSKNKIIFIEERKELETGFYILILAMLSVIFIIIANILYNKKEFYFNYIIFSIFFVLSLVFTLATLIFTGIFGPLESGIGILFITLFVSIFGSVAFSYSDNYLKTLRVLTIINCILMGTYFTFMFLGI